MAMLISSSTSPSFSLHFLPVMPSTIFRSSTPRSASPYTTPSSPNSRCPSPTYGRAASCDSQTIHHRRTTMRANSGMRTPPPPPLNGFADFFHTRTAAPFSVPMQQESDAQCWERMLALQREYHCYKSARLEAAVEALERGCSIEDVPMRKWPAQSLYIPVVWRLTDYNSIEAVPRSPE